MAYIPTALPGFTYTGSCKAEMIDGWGWAITFTSDGTLTFDSDHRLDVFAVGGGGGGAGNEGGGGGGGYVKSGYNLVAVGGTAYTVRVGEGGKAGLGISESYGGTGGTSSAFGVTAAGGQGGQRTLGGAGGSGGGGGGGAGDPGYGGSNGEDGEDGVSGYAGWGKGGTGAGSTTKPFDGAWSTPYSGGGGGGTRPGSSIALSKGGETGGGDGNGGDGAANTGGGGAGGRDWGAGGRGGSGIVIIRNNEYDVLPVCFNGTWLTRLYLNGVEVTEAMYDETVLFMRRLRAKMCMRAKRMKERRNGRKAYAGNGYAAL